MDRTKLKWQDEVFTSNLSVGLWLTKWLACWFPLSPREGRELPTRFSVCPALLPCALPSKSHTCHLDVQARAGPVLAGWCSRKLQGKLGPRLIDILFKPEIFVLNQVILT